MTGLRQTSKYFLIIFVVFLPIALFLPGCNSSHPEEKYVTQPVQWLRLEQKVVANGSVNPIETVKVGAQVSGIIKEIFVDFNSSVRRGQIIARIDPTVYATKVAQARSAMALAQAEVEKAKTNLNFAATQLRRYQSLWQQKLVSQLDLDNNQALSETAQADFQATRARYAQAKALFSEAEANLGYTNIISPVNGIVISRNVDVGQTVVSAFQTPTLFTIAQDLTQMQVAAEVDGSQVGEVKVGQPATFTVDAYKDKVFSGKIDQVRLAPNTTQNVVTYTILIQTTNPDLLLKPGMIATVTILTASQDNALAVPNAALRFQPKGMKAPVPKDSQVVWRLGSDQKPQSIVVTCGINDGLWTEIKPGILKAGDQVIIDQVETASGGAMSLKSLFF